MEPLIANREWVDKACEDLLQPDCQKRILLFSGESGIGKSTLLEIFQSKLSSKTCYLSIDFQDSSIDICKIFCQIGYCLGWSNLPNFIEQIDALQVVSYTQASLGSRLITLFETLPHYFSNEDIATLCFKLGIEYDDLPGQGRKSKMRELVKHLDYRAQIPEFVEICRQERPKVSFFSEQFHTIEDRIRIALCADQESCWATLTDAWVKDLKLFDRLMIIALDTCEEAVTEVQNWIGGSFLSKVARIDKIRVLLAGQNLPNPKNSEWEPWCESYDIDGVQEVRYWLPIVEAENRKTPHEPHAWLHGVCTALKGHPESIIKVIQGLPTG